MYPTTTAANLVEHRSGNSGLAELFEVILDRGLVIDAYVRVSLVGIELLTVDARIVIASVDTYLHFAEAVNRLDLREVSQAKTLADMDSMAEEAVDGATDEAEESVKSAIPFVDDEDEERDKQEA